MEQAGVPAEKVDHGGQAAQTLAEHRGRRRPGQAEAQNAHEQQVQRHVGQPRRHRHRQAQLGPLGHHEKALKHVLQHEGPGG